MSQVHRCDTTGERTLVVSDRELDRLLDALVNLEGDAAEQGDTTLWDEPAALRERLSRSPDSPSPEPSPLGSLYRAEIAIWAPIDPATVELSKMAREAETGEALATRMRVMHVPRPDLHAEADELGWFGEIAWWYGEATGSSE